MDAPPPPPPPPAQLQQDQGPPPPPPSAQVGATQYASVSPYDILYQRQSAVEAPTPADPSSEHQQFPQPDQHTTASQAGSHYPPPPDIQPDPMQQGQPAGDVGAAQQPDTQISQEQYANMSEQDQNTYWQQWHEYEQYQQWQQQEQARQWEAYYAAQVQPQPQQAAYDMQYQQQQAYQSYQQPPQQQQQQQQQWPQQPDPYSQYQQYSAPAAQAQQPPQQGYGQAPYQQPGTAYASMPSTASAQPYAPSHSGSMGPQAAHALPQPPSGGIAAMHILRAGLQPPPPKKPAVPDWVRQELLKRGLQSDGSGVKARGGSDSEGDDVAAKHPRRFTEKGSGSGSRWGADAGILAAKARQHKAAGSDSEEDSEAEAEEAERQARVSLEMKKSLTHILLHVTDSLFDSMALEVCQEATSEAAQQKHGAASSAAESEHESDSAAAGGGDLLGLGYTSDGDSQDSAPKSKPVKSETAQSANILAAVQADSIYDPRDKRDPSMSPTTAAGGWMKQEEEDGKKVDTAAKPFVKGQRLWYLEKDGGRAASTLVSVDNSVAPPSYAVRIDKTNSVRETEGHRLQQMLAPESDTNAALSNVKVEPPAAVSSMEQIIQSMQQIKAAASVAKPTLPPKRTPLATPSAPPPAPVATPQPEPAQPVPASEAEQSSAPTSSAKLLEPSRPSAAAERQPVATGVGQLSALAANAKSAVDSVPSAFNDTSDHLLQQKTKSHASDQTELVPSTSQASAPHKAAAINATQAGPVTAGADQVALGATGSQADAIGAKPSLDTKPPKDSKSHKETRAQRESRDSGDKRSRGKEKDSSKGKHGKKDKRSSRGERRRSISRSRSRFPKRRKASSSPGQPRLTRHSPLRSSARSVSRSPGRKSIRSRRHSPSPPRRRTRDSRSPGRRGKSPSRRARSRSPPKRGTRDSRSPPRRNNSPSPAKSRSSRSPARHKRRSRSPNRRRKDSPSPGRRRRSAVQRRSSSPARR